MLCGLEYGDPAHRPCEYEQLYLPEPLCHHGGGGHRAEGADHGSRLCGRGADCGRNYRVRIQWETTIFRGLLPEGNTGISTYGIDFEELYRRGYRGILFDIDNTLVPHDAPATQESVELFRRLHAIGFHTCLISNNKEPRVTPFAKAMETPYVYKADKPSRKGYQEGMRRMGTDLADTLFIGDQLFTDVWGANRTGLYSILVKPMNPKEEIQIVLKRYLEKIVLFFYLRGEGKK